jgi:hypothetical protein
MLRRRGPDRLAISSNAFILRRSRMPAGAVKVNVALIDRSGASISWLARGVVVITGCSSRRQSAVTSSTRAPAAMRADVLWREPRGNAGSEMAGVAALNRQGGPPAGEASALQSLQRLIEADFMPHGCWYLWLPEILWLHVLSNGRTRHRPPGRVFPSLPGATLI